MMAIISIAMANQLAIQQPRGKCICIHNYNMLYVTQLGNAHVLRGKISFTSTTITNNIKNHTVSTGQGVVVSYQLTQHFRLRHGIRSHNSFWFETVKVYECVSCGVCLCMCMCVCMYIYII